MSRQPYSKKRKTKTANFDFRYYSAVSSLPILVIAGLFVGFYIGESLGGGSLSSLLAVLGAISGLAISLYELIRLERKESKQHNVDVDAFNKFAKKAERMSAQNEMAESVHQANTE